MIAQEFSEDRRVSHVRFSGSITTNEFAQYRESVYAENNTGQWASLIDCSSLDSLDVDFERIRSHVASVDSLNSNRSAGFTEIIFAPTDLGFGIARMYQSLAEGKFEVVVCKELEVAQQALAMCLETKKQSPEC